MGTLHTWADAPDPLALSYLLSSPAPSVGGGLCREDWLMGPQVALSNRSQANPAGRQGVDCLLGCPGRGRAGRRARCPESGDTGQDPNCTIFCFDGVEGDLCPPPSGTVPRREPCRQGRLTEVGEAQGLGSPSRGKAAVGQGLGGPRAGLPRGHDASPSQALQTTPPTLAILEGEAGRAAGSVSGDPKTPRRGTGRGLCRRQAGATQRCPSFAFPVFKTRGLHPLKGSKSFQIVKHVDSAAHEG